MTRPDLAPLRALAPAAAWALPSPPPAALRAVVADVRARTRRVAVPPARP